MLLVSSFAPSFYVDSLVNASNGQLVHNNGLSNSIIAQGGEYNKIRFTEIMTINSVIQEESNKIIEDNNGACNIEQ